MPWFRAMGADSVLYHQETVLGRDDDHPGRALAYYGSRGETPLEWRGNLATDLGLAGAVTPEEYAAVFGPRGARHPVTGDQLVKTKRPGFEFVVSAHKSVALLGVVGRADDMHALLDAETRGTMRALGSWMQTAGGRRGRSVTPTPTVGLLYAVTRHGTSRAGDPAPHDHVLVANVTQMLDAKGGHKALYSALLRDWGEAATMVGRLEAAAVAVKLGYAIEPDGGKTGRARGWRITGIPHEVCEVFSKRADQIQDYIDQRGLSGYRARNIAARQTRAVKRGTGVDELMPRWHSELEELGWTVDDLLGALDEARAAATGLRPALTGPQLDDLAAEVLSPEGPLLQRSKVFTRTRLIAEIAPLLYGHEPAELDRVLEHIINSDLLIPLVGAAGPERHYTTREVLETEKAIADQIEALTVTPGPALNPTLIEDAIAAKQAEIGNPLTPGQRATIEAICASGRAVELVVGVAGAGKTTALDAATTALQQAGYRVTGAATSGQAAQTLGRKADIEARTIRSMLYRLDHRRDRLDRRTVLVIDEAGMTADADLARLLLAARHTGTKVVLVGDPRQLSPVGPGGALAAVIAAHPEIVTQLTENVRQHDPAERQALAHLRNGDTDAALGFYESRHRVHVADDEIEVMAEMVTAWANDTHAGHDTLMMAWRRDHVAGLNQIARAVARERGWVTGPDLEAPGGNPYAAGDPVVLLAPNHEGRLVTSQRATVVGIDHHTHTLHLVTDDDTQVSLRGEEINDKRLTHGYAVTVHRQQGGTCDRAHYLAGGGGQELAYVALSRARQQTHIYTIPADPDEAYAQLADDWATQQAQQWVTQAHQPATPAESERARLQALLEIANHNAPPDVSKHLDRVIAKVGQLRQDIDDLQAGTGRWQDQPAGRAAQRLRAAQRARQEAANALQEAPLWRQPGARRALATAEKAEALATQDRHTTTEPLHSRLQADLEAAQRQLPTLQTAHSDRRQWLHEHPDQAATIRAIKRELQRLDDPINAQLLDIIDRLDRLDQQIPDQPPGLEPPTQDLNAQDLGFDQRSWL